jgi:hypothetical protein
VGSKIIVEALVFVGAAATLVSIKSPYKSSDILIPAIYFLLEKGGTIFESLTVHFLSGATVYLPEYALELIKECPGDE